MGRDDIVVINQGLESRTSKSGKTRHTIVVKSEPLIFNLDAKAIGATVALAIVHHLRERVRGITENAKPATIAARKVAARAYAAGKPWAMKRYAGGKTGATPPTTSEKAFNFSERFANSITGNASSDGAWRINVAANRLNPAFGDVTRIWNKLVELVPEFGDPKRLLESDIIRKTIERAAKDMVKKAKASTGKLQIQLVKDAFGLVQQVGSILAG